MCYRPNHKCTTDLTTSVPLLYSLRPREAFLYFSVFQVWPMISIVAPNCELWTMALILLTDYNVGMLQNSPSISHLCCIMIYWSNPEQMLNVCRIYFWSNPEQMLNVCRSVPWLVDSLSWFKTPKTCSKGLKIISAPNIILGIPFHWLNTALLEWRRGIAGSTTLPLVYRIA